MFGRLVLARLPDQLWNGGASVSSMSVVKVRSALTSTPITAHRSASRITSTGRLLIVAPSTNTSPVVHHGRRHAGDRHRGAQQPAPQLAAAMDRGLPEIRFCRHAIETAAVGSSIATSPNSRRRARSTRRPAPATPAGSVVAERAVVDEGGRNTRASARRASRAAAPMIAADAGAAHQVDRHAGARATRGSRRGARSCARHRREHQPPDGGKAGAAAPPRHVSRSCRTWWCAGCTASQLRRRCHATSVRRAAPSQRAASLNCASRTAPAPSRCRPAPRPRRQRSAMSALAHAPTAISSARVVARHGRRSRSAPRP